MLFNIRNILLILFINLQTIRDCIITKIESAPSDPTLLRFDVPGSLVTEINDELNKFNKNVKSKFFSRIKTLEDEFLEPGIMVLLFKSEMNINCFINLLMRAKSFLGILGRKFYNEKYCLWNNPDAAYTRMCAGHMEETIICNNDFHELRQEYDYSTNTELGYSRVLLKKIIWENKLAIRRFLGNDNLYDYGDSFFEKKRFNNVDLNRRMISKQSKIINKFFIHHRRYCHALKRKIFFIFEKEEKPVCDNWIYRKDEHDLSRLHSLLCDMLIMLFDHEDTDKIFYNFFLQEDLPCFSYGEYELRMFLYRKLRYYDELI